MKNLFKKFAVFLSILLAGASLVTPAFADVGDVTIWNLKGTYAIDFTCTGSCGGIYTHTLNVTTEDDNTGNFSGNGFYNTDPSYTWSITGNIAGSSNALSFHALYIGANPGYTLDGTGNVAYDGTLSGTATSNGGQTFTWKSTSGKAKHERIHIKQEVNKKQCNPFGKPIINISEKIKNDVDSGFAGNYWAFDNYTRNIKVYNTVGSKFCADVTYDGTFKTVAGQTGPAGTGIIGSNFTGNFDGGYRSVEFTGVLKAPGPNFHSTTGNVGTFNYACNISGTCPGYFSWISEYFSSTSTFDYAWWGWTYHAGKHGTWINASNGNSGNIL